MATDVAQGSTTAVSEADDPAFRQVLSELRGSIRWLRWAAGLVFLVGSVATAVVLVKLPALTAKASERLSESHNSANLMVFELLRGAAYAAAATSILFGILTLGRACLDQATRFQKRLVAAHFLNFVLHTYSDELKAGTMKLPEVVDFLKAWSENIDSAFTNVKFGSRKQTTQVAVGPVAATSGSGAVPSTP